MGYHKQFNLRGINFNSQKDPTMTRQELLEGVGKKSRLTLEQFEYEGTPALYVINQYNKLDIGVVPAEDVGKILPHINEPYEISIVDRYYFDDEKCGLKLQFAVLDDVEEQPKPEKPLYKRKWFIAVVIYFCIAVFVLIGMMLGW